MDTGLASRIVKARQYAQERDRVDLTHLEAKFKGEHDTYQINYDNNQWRCTCEEAVRTGVCSHIMAMERILGDLVPMAATAKPVLEPALAF